MLYSRRRIGLLASLVITAMVLALLIIPVYILWHLTRAIQSGTDTAIIIALLLVFTLTFSGTLSLVTRAQRHEILASAAAYVNSKVLSWIPRS
jgi:hypothetical protein